MATQFNLLPDVKLAFIKAQRTKRMAVSISLIAIAAAIAILIIMLALVGWQKKSLNDLNGDISRYSGQINGTSNLDKILTVQNQLNSLPNIDDKKPDTTRLFNYISQLTPNQISFSQFNIDFTQNTVDITGTGSSLATINQFVDTLKFATYTAGNSSQGKSVFSKVVLANFGIAQQGSASTGDSFEVTADFDPTIFNSAQNVTLKVPNEVTTRSSLDQPQFTGNNNNGGQ